MNNNLTKLLFHVLQCLHHLNTLLTNDRVFHGKRQQLLRFMIPAQDSSNSVFQQEYQRLVTLFLGDSITALMNHYKRQLDLHWQTIAGLKFSFHERETSKEIALRWGGRNFGGKLSFLTIQQFLGWVNRLHIQPTSSQTPENSQSSQFSPSLSPHLSLLSRTRGSYSKMGHRSFPTTVASHMPLSNHPVHRPPLLPTPRDSEKCSQVQQTHSIPHSSRSSSSRSSFTRCSPLLPTPGSRNKRTKSLPTTAEPHAPSFTHRPPLLPTPTGFGKCSSVHQTHSYSHPSHSFPARRPPLLPTPRDHSGIGMRTSPSTSAPRIRSWSKWEELQDLCCRSVVSPGYSGFLHPQNLHTLDPSLPNPQKSGCNPSSHLPIPLHSSLPTKPYPHLSLPTICSHSAPSIIPRPTYSSILQKPAASMPNIKHPYSTKTPVKPNRDLPTTPHLQQLTPPSLHSHSSQKHSLANNPEILTVDDSTLDPTHQASSTRVSQMPAPIRIIQGHRDPLSNFFPCTINFNGNRFRSAEHAYQYSKATFLGASSMLTLAIRNAPYVKDAKTMGTQVTQMFQHNHRKMSSWNSQKRSLMGQILLAKARQVDLFKQELLKTEDMELRHNVPDSFWGSSYTDHRTGTAYQGKNVLVGLLQRVRHIMQIDVKWSLNNAPQGTLQTDPLPSTSSTPSNPSTHSTNPTPSPNPTPSLPSSNPTPANSPTSFNSSFSCAVSNPFSPLSVDDYPPLPAQSSSPANLSGNSTDLSCSPKILGYKAERRRNMKPTFFNSSSKTTSSPSPCSSLNLSPCPSTPIQTSTQPTSRAYTQTSNLASELPPVSGPNITCHKDRTKWKIPKIRSKVAILGDSNINRADTISAQTRSIECHSYPGARLCHLNNMFSKHQTPQEMPEVVILSIGINNRDNQPATHKSQLNTLLKSCSKVFPKSQIYIPQINVPPQIPPHQTNSLMILNQMINELTKNTPNVHTITKLPHNKYTIDAKDTKYRIHWNRATANEMLSHWLSHLN